MTISLRVCIKNILYHFISYNLLIHVVLKKMSMKKLYFNVGIEVIQKKINVPTLNKPLMIRFFD